MKKINILVLVFVSVALDATAIAARTLQSGSIAQPVQVDTRRRGNAISTDTPTNPPTIATSKVDACTKNGEYPRVGCAPLPSPRNRRAAKQLDAKSDPRRWTSTLGF